MNRYYHTNDNQRDSNDRKSTSTTRIELPEFIPFDNEYQRDNGIPQQQASSSYNRNNSRSPNRNKDRSDQRRNSERSSEHNSHSTNNNRESGDQRRPSRDSYRSSNKSSSPRRTSSYPLRRSRSRTNRQRSRSRSRSPQQTSRQRHQPISFPSDDLHRNEDRALSNGGRNGSSVFDRISSPPERIVRRSVDAGRPGEGRRSDESINGRGSQPHLFRTVNTSTSIATRSRHFEGPIYQSIDLTSENSRFQPADEDYFENQRRFLADPIDVVSAGLPGSILFEETVEMRNMKERLNAAVNHCLGLEQTVRSYGREILKLRQIVNELIKDFQDIQSRIR